MEGAGSFGAGLTVMLQQHGEQVVEVGRPKRPARRSGAKSDALDAVRAAREVEVLRLVACGSSNKEIADALVISRKTAANHVEHIYAKIDVSNRARAALFAMQHGLMTDVPASGGDKTGREG